jgi:bacteriorhodopsin
MEELNQKKLIDVTPKERLVKVTFYITYAFLLTTATITFIEAMRTQDPRVRHILNLETCISIVAAFFYSKFMKKLNQYSEDDKDINYKEINITRYTDWMITTPIMLLVLCLVFGYNNKTVMSASYFLIVMLVNFLMLAFGYVGEVGLLNKRLGQLGGFIFFFILYGMIYYTFLHGRNSFDNKMIFWAFVFFWFFYGVLYDMDEETKNVGYNVLDLFSKCFVGIFFWAYLTKVIKFF